MTDTTRLRPEPDRPPIPQAWQPAGADPWAEAANWTTQPIPVVQDEPEPPRPAGMYVTAAVGAVLVLYSYLVALWPVRHGFTPDLVLAVREWVTFPLGIGADFGLFGVGLLLAAGGFWACSRLAEPGGRGRLLWRVVALGYLPYLLASLISFVLLFGDAEPLTEPRRADPDGMTLPMNLLLVDRVTGQDALIGRGWGVTAAAFIAVLIAVTAPMLTGGRWLALGGLALQLVVIGLIALTGTDAGGWYHEFGQLVTWCLFGLVGQLAWIVRRHPGSGWAAAPLGVGCLVVIVAAERGYAAQAAQWLPLTFTFVALVTLLAVRACAHGGRVDRARLVRWLGSRAYPAALLACAIGYPLLGVLYHAKLPFGLAVVIALAVTLALAEAVHRLGAVIAR